MRKETYRTKHRNKIDYFFYYILIEFKEEIYIPYARESKTDVILLDNFQCEEGKKIAHFTVHEIKKLLNYKIIPLIAFAPQGAPVAEPLYMIF